MQDPDFDEVRASARLPRLDIDIVHRRSRAGDAELMTITMRAVPGFEAFERALQAANPFHFWLRLAELAWAPWLQASRNVLAPSSDRESIAGEAPKLLQHRGSPRRLTRPSV
jgi:hypothetical protein